MDEKQDGIDRTRRMAQILRGDREAYVEFVIELAELDRLRRWEAMGYPRVWDYCADEFKLSRAQIFYRTNAAYVIQKAPMAADYLRDGRLCMTTIVELVDVITPENAKDLLERSSWKSKEEVAHVAVSVAPKPNAVKSSSAVRKQPGRPRQAAMAAEGEPKPKAEPLAEDRFGMTIRFDRAFKE